MDKRLHPSLPPKEGDLGIAKNYQSTTLTSIVDNIYNALLLNRIEPEIEKILRKNQTIRWIIEVCAKNLKATVLFVDFSKAFDSIHRRKMEQILPSYSLPQGTATAIMMLNSNTKVNICSPDGETDFFDIVARVLFIICQDYLLWMLINLMKENGFTLKKKGRSRWYPTQTITDADFADDIPKSNPWSKQPEALVSTWMQTKWSTCFNKKKGTSPF